MTERSIAAGSDAEHARNYVIEAKSESSRSEGPKGWDVFQGNYTRL